MTNLWKSEIKVTVRRGLRNIKITERKQNGQHVILVCT
jgi:hypothetical protein